MMEVSSSMTIATSGLHTNFLGGGPDCTFYYLYAGALCKNFKI